ncbi:DUF4287 domain-containing protein [Pedobacter jamesrossensis]|uniref:DUF4287 domain-containing protein n=1 Tax=Pedobacter jamesrossensis TaxID=1908238 RepID=A0ABV8NJY3_9SPHI
MSFQAYIDNIRIKTGKSVEDFKKLAAQKGFIQDGKVKVGVKATQITVNQRVAGSSPAEGSDAQSVSSTPSECGFLFAQNLHS